MWIVEFVSWVAVIALMAAFLLGLANKWGWIEWLQVHAPNDFLHDLFSCKFCCSWWVSVLISLTLCVASGEWLLLCAPFFTTVITRELW